MEHALPRTWSLCMTSENHGTVGPAGCTFSHAPEKHERVLVVEALAGTRVPVAEFKGYVDGQPAVTWFDRDNMPRVGTKLFVHAAANKAAEEGELPELPECCGGTGLQTGCLGEGPCYTCMAEAEDQKRAQKYVDKALAADRASRQAELTYTVNGVLMSQLEYIDHLHGEIGSRQVANKAEVEPVAQSLPAKFWALLNDRENAETVDTLNEVNKNIVDYLSSFNSIVRSNPERFHWSKRGMELDPNGYYIATPPATTGASTGLLAAIEALFWEFEKGAAPFTVKAALNQLEEDGVEVSIDPKNAREIFAAAGLFGDQVNASTVLTNERMPVMYAAKRIDNGEYGSLLHRSEESAYRHNQHNGAAAPKYTVVAMREVAAQAGQVAVPDFEQRAKAVWNDAMEEAALICDGVNNHDNPMTANDCADAIRELKAAAPSPAKESK